MLTKLRASSRFSSLVAWCVLAAVSGMLTALGEPASQASQIPALDGTWINDKGEEIDIDHLEGSGLVFGYFTAASAGGPCPHGGGRQLYFEGRLSGGVLTGTIWLCTYQEELVTKCNVPSVFSRRFNTTGITAERIDGERDMIYSEGPGTPDAQGCPYVRNPSKDGVSKFFLTRACAPDAARRCGAIGEASRTVRGALDSDAQFPTANFDAWKQRLLRQIKTIAGMLCDDAEKQKIVDNLVSTLEGLTYGGGTPTLAQKQVLARLDLDLASVQSGLCASNAGGTCPGGSRPKTTDDDAALEQVTGGIEAAIAQLKEEAERIEGAGSTAAQQIEEIRGKIAKLQRYKGFWDKVRAASCIPPEIPQLIRQILAGDRDNWCPNLCAKTADWLISINPGPEPGAQRQMFFVLCTNQCL
jgi:hypothetical protein